MEQRGAHDDGVMATQDAPTQGKRPHAYHRECGAKSRSGQPCKGPAMLNGRCRMHGGNAPKGIAAPDFRAGGRYSKYLPGRLMERYQEAVADGDLLNLRHDIALLDARLADLLRRVDSGESMDGWKRAKEAWKAYKRAPLEERQQWDDTLSDLLTQGQGDAQAWEEIEKVLQDRKKLVESERKRLVEMQQTITAEQAMGLLAAVVDTVQKHVTDRDARIAISTDFARLMGAGLPRPISAA